jgi:hypothetical protein
MLVLDLTKSNSICCLQKIEHEGTKIETNKK